MEAKFRDIDNDIKNNEYKRVYLLYGDETYLVRQYKNKLLKALVAEGDVMNFTAYEGKDTDIVGIIDLANTMPMFAEYRVILIEDSGFFKRSCDDLSEFIKEGVPDSAVIIFSENEVDKRGKLYKAVKDAGMCVDFSTPDDATLSKWVLSRIKKEDISITQRALHSFLEKCGGSMEIIDTELEKLISKCLITKSIDVVDVDEIVTTQTENHIFEMIDALAAGNRKKAFMLYHDLIELKEPPMRILFLITRQFNILLMIKKMELDHIAVPEMAKKLSLRDFVIRKNLKVTGRFKEEELTDYIKRCVDSEYQVKTGALSDMIAVEMLFA